MGYKQLPDKLNVVVAIRFSVRQDSFSESGSSSNRVMFISLNITSARKAGM